MTYPRIAVSCVVRRQNRYLLVRRGTGTAAGDYAFPGGKVEAGERLTEASLRELQEETGLLGNNVRFFRLYELIDAGDDGVVESHYVLAVHLAEINDGQEAVAGDDADTLGWFEASEIRGMQVPLSVLECIEHFERRGIPDAHTSRKSEHA